ncbi:hypothetical protein Ahy_B08g089608 [Arachis hypogaea]|uniref:Uncharacterized protein n=1 Tax=Arachis hypogaea TaxID=3818 RepID=A0A444XYB1_ARAHY|nr:hypothetical protein Ahy_B08g089608 [Arachis hypogaea]
MYALMSDILCSHAISCINFKGFDLESYMDDCYKKDAYRKCYQEVIHPVNGLDLWKRIQYDNVMPPPYRRPNHRLVKKRKRGPGDKENRSQNHMSQRDQIQICSNFGDCDAELLQVPDLPNEKNHNHPEPDTSQKSSVFFLSLRHLLSEGVEITQPDLFNNGMMVIHGLQGFIAPFSCDVERMTSLSFPFHPDHRSGQHINTSIRCSLLSCA